MKKRSIASYIIIIFLIIAIIFLFRIYKSNNFNNFILSERNSGKSSFSRDNEEKYQNKTSYKITSQSYNDAMFSEKIKVKKDTPYKVTCMVKTKDVESSKNVAGSGAQISIEDTTERSTAVAGTTDWQEIEMIFNSKNREEVNVGFRLGGYIDECKGEAWFANLKIVEGQKEAENSNWKFACFIFENLETTIDGQNISYSLTNQDVADMQNTIKRFEKAAGTMSDGKMQAKCDVYKVSTPIDTLTYDEEYGYYVAPETVEKQIKKDVDENNYDHIFIIFKLDDKEVKDWVGLGAMDYYGVGYSNIRLTTQYNYLYKYDSRINRFPEEVLMHEFLHSLERTLKEYGYDRPELHDNEKYGYKNQYLDGLKDWYEDYMNCNIKTSNGKIGLDPIVYTLKPAKESEFTDSQAIESAFFEPQNILQEITQLFKKVKTNITNMIS